MKKYFIGLTVLIVISSWLYLGQANLTVEANENVYVVTKGDTLYDISKKYNISVNEIKKANGLTSTTIRIEQRLTMPMNDGKDYYRVKSGDTLYSIARKEGLPVDKIKKLNNLEDNLIIVGQRLSLGEPAVTTVSNTKSGLAPENGFSGEEVELLARMIHAESRGESYEGKVAVGAVIINRVESDEFPSTIEEVIYQRTRYGFQFTPVQDGTFYLEPDEISMEAAYDAVRGLDPTEGSLYFYNPDIATDQWITTLPVSTKIGNHVFAR